MTKFYLYVNIDGGGWQYVTMFSSLKKAEFALKYYYHELGYWCKIASVYIQGDLRRVKKEYVYVH